MKTAIVAWALGVLILMMLYAVVQPARAAGPAASVVVVDEAGGIRPPGAVASISDLSQTAALSIAAGAQADAVAAAAVLLSNEVNRIDQTIAAQLDTGYIRGYITSFEGGLPPNTNITASIVKFEPDGVEGTNAFFNVYTFFSEDPGTFPEVRYATALGQEAAWETATAVGEPVLDTVLVDGTLYDAFRNRIAMPEAFAHAYFRVYADVEQFGGDAEFLFVRNGISVQGEPPLTATLTEGTNTLRIVGGIIVEP